MTTTRAHQAQFQYQPGDGYAYLWGGGPYIDVYRVHPHNGRLSSTDININVWDYVTGQPTIARTGEALMREVDHWREITDWPNP